MLLHEITQREAVQLDEAKKTKRKRKAKKAKWPVVTRGFGWGSYPGGYSDYTGGGSGDGGGDGGGD